MSLLPPRPRASLPAVLTAFLLLPACDGVPTPTGIDPDASIAVSPATLTIVTGERSELAATVLDADGNPVHLPVEWSSRNDAVVSVSGDGEVHGVAEGSAAVFAMLGDARDSTVITVRAPEPGEEPEPDDPPSSDPPPSDPPPANPYPREPSGNTLIAWSPMSEMFSWGPSNLSSGTGSWWQYRQGDPNTTIRTGEGVPRGPHFNRTRYPAGINPGSGPVSWGGWNAGSSQKGTQQRSLYFSQHIRLVDGGSGTWESQRVGTKLGFWGVGRCNAAMNDLYAFLQGGTRSEFSIRMMQQNVQSRSMSQNRKSGAVMRVGRWHHWEMEMVLNDVGRANGIFRWWIDGDLIMEYTDVVYRTSGDRCGFLAYVWSPTWGGTGGGSKSRTDYIDISDIRISGKRL